MIKVCVNWFHETLHYVYIKNAKKNQKSNICIHKHAIFWTWANICGLTCIYSIDTKIVKKNEFYTATLTSFWWKEILTKRKQDIETVHVQILYTILSHQTEVWTCFMHTHIDIKAGFYQFMLQRNLAHGDIHV